MSNAQDFLMGGGVKSAKFMGRNNPVQLTITQEPEVRQQTDYNTKEPKFFKNGDPMMQLVVTGTTDQRDPEDTDDDGTRAFYVKGKQLTSVVRDAVKAAGAKGIQVGGVLTLTWVSGGPRYDGDTTWMKENPKVYAAQYQKPINTAANNFLATAGEPAPAVATGPADLAALFANLPAEQRAALLAQQNTASAPPF